jgi:hypothetical protein
MDSDNIKELQELNQRVTEMAAQALREGTDISDHTDFQDIMKELMEKDEDGLMALLGMALDEAGDDLPEWISEGLDDN